MATGSADLAASALGQMLRARRARLSPSEVGLANGRRRRTPGLRREEVAQLASISVTYYALIERGRAKHPSPQVIDALTSALRLEPSEHDYLRTLAGITENPPAGSMVETLAPGIADLVARLDPHPTYVTGQRWDVLAANQAACALWTDWSALPSQDRNMLVWMFTEPAAQSIIVEWEAEAAALLGRFRAAAARHLGEPTFTELINRLHTNSPQARSWWDRVDIAPLGGGHKRLRHPELGEIDLQHVVLQVAENPEHKLVTFVPTPTDEQRIASLIGESPSAAPRTTRRPLVLSDAAST